jgi:hypothetical protein
MPRIVWLAETILPDVTDSFWDVQPWMVPFIVQLCGEYVIEIGQVIHRFATEHLPDPRLLTAFASSGTPLPPQRPVTGGWACGLRCHAQPKAPAARTRALHYQRGIRMVGLAGHRERPGRAAHVHRH